MIFHTPFTQPRPIRLCEATRRFAQESLDGKYGRDALDHPLVKMTDGDFGQMSPTDRYDAAIEAIVRQAPIRICRGELISGAATLGQAIMHVVPAAFPDGSFIDSVSHLTVDFFEVLAVGYEGIGARAARCARENTDPGKARFYQSVLHCLRCFRIYHERYLEVLSGMPEYAENYEILRRVPAQGARTFREAVQSLWFTFSFIRLCGNWPGIGRIDLLLGEYLERDLAEGRLTLEQAREILAHFFIKGCEWINGQIIGSGDAQHYQNIVLSGIGPDGRDVTNAVSYLVLDVVEELSISDFPVTVRLHRGTDPAFLRRVAEVIRYGGGTVAVYNEELILDSLTRYGYPPEDAARFANDGCWEVQVPGETNFIYVPFDGLQTLQDDLLNGYRETGFESWESLYTAYAEELARQIDDIESRYIGNVWNAQEHRFRAAAPCTVISLFEKDCIGRGLSYFEGGTNYTAVGIHIGGLADTVNSLYAIKKLVYDDRVTDLAELFAALRTNWEGYEELRQTAATRYRYFGNGSAEVDGIYRRLLGDFGAACRQHDGETPIRFPAGVSTFGRQIEWAGRRMATAFGRTAGEILSGNASPTPGTDYEGATSIIRSYCAADLRDIPNGAALDMRLSASTLDGEAGLRALMALLTGFVKLGGFFMQIDTADAALLRRAQEHPEQYQSLSVRVSGWNARFATLSREWQDMVIGQAEGKR